MHNIQREQMFLCIHSGVDNVLTELHRLLENNRFFSYVAMLGWWLARVRQNTYRNTYECMFV